jgi:hypothetical protein
MADNPTNPNQPNAPPAPASPPTPGAPVTMTVPAKKQRSRFSQFIGYVLFARGKDDEIVIISHSPLFYWWPVWFFGYVIAAITYFEDTHAAFVPHNTDVVRIKRTDFEAMVEKLPDPEQRDALTKLALKKPKSGTEADVVEILVPPGDSYIKIKDDKHGEEWVAFPRKWIPKDQDYEFVAPRMHSHRTPGGIFMLVLLMVIVITNIPLRGLWSLIIIIVLILGTIILAQSGVWDRIVRGGGQILAVHINFGGYVFISTALFALWFINFFFFDRQIYMIFTPGQVRVHLEIGGGETAYDTTGMVFQKQRSDVFRHYILGFGSGDLIIRPGGGKEHIDMHNVLNVGRRVREIERALQERQVVAGQS